MSGYRFGYQTSPIDSEQRASDSLLSAVFARFGWQSSPCHGEGRGFESLHPLHARPPEFRRSCTFKVGRAIRGLAPSNARHRFSAEPRSERRFQTTSSGGAAGSTQIFLTFFKRLIE